MSVTKRFIELAQFNKVTGFTWQTVYYYNEKGQNVNLFKDITKNKKYTPSKGDKLYFYPNCTVPRFKVSSYNEKHGTKTTRSEADADAKFISQKYLQSLLVENRFTYSMDKQMFIAFLRKYFMYYNATTELIADLEGCDGEHVFYKFRVTHDMNHVVDSDHHPDDIDYENAYRVRLGNKEVADAIEKLLNDSVCYDQDEILKDINSGNVMDGNMYHSIKRLLNSEDPKDHKVAIECMANCDYTKSCVYLLLLLKEYGYTIWQNPARNQVNFKALLNFFDLSTYDMRSVSLDGIMQTLISKKLLNKSNLDLLMPLAIENSSTGSNNHFKVVTIEPTPDVITATEDSILNKDCDTEIVTEPTEQINPHLE